LVPARNLAGIEKIIDQRRDSPAPRIPRRITKSLAEKAALWMRMQIEEADDFGGGETNDGISLHIGLGFADSTGPRGIVQSEAGQIRQPGGEQQERPSGPRIPGSGRRLCTSTTGSRNVSRECPPRTRNNILEIHTAH